MFYSVFTPSNRPTNGPKSDFFFQKSMHNVNKIQSKKTFGDIFIIFFLFRDNRKSPLILLQRQNQGCSEVAEWVIINFQK